MGVGWRALSICSIRKQVRWPLAFLRIALCLSDPDMMEMTFAFVFENGVRYSEAPWCSRMSTETTKVGQGVVMECLNVFELAQRQVWELSGQYGYIPTVSGLPESPFFSLLVK